jgi:hypothetical protein
MALIHQIKVCKICNKNYSPKKGVSNAQWLKSSFCSLYCFGKSILGKKLTNEHKKNISLKSKGRVFSESTRLKISIKNTGRKFTEEHKLKISLSNTGKKSPIKGIKLPERSGKNHFNWIEDRSKIKTGDRSMNDPLQKNWRKEVKNLDKWKCRLSNVDCNGKLEAHHIMPWSEFPELRYDLNNGITLCHKHHPRKKDDVKKYEECFKKLILTRDNLC